MGNIQKFILAATLLFPAMAMANVDMSYEGLYTVTVQQDATVDRLVVMETGDAVGTVVSLVSTQLGSPFVIFTHATFDRTTSTLRADLSNNGGAIASVVLTIDKVNNKVTGTLTHKDYPGVAGLIQGTPLQSPADFIAGNPPLKLAPEALAGQYQGQMFGIDGTLILQMTSEHFLAAAFTSQDSNFVIGFGTVDYDSDRGLLTIANTDRVEQGFANKAVLAYRQVQSATGSTLSLSGLAFTANGNGEVAQFSSAVPTH